MSEQTLTAKSPITPAAPATVVAGWEVSARRSPAALTLTDETPLAKVQVKGGTATEHTLGVPAGRAARDENRVLVAGAGPGEWLLLASPGASEQLSRRIEQDLSGATELVTVMDLTHGRAMMRLTGDRSTDLLAKVCAIDFADTVTPNGAAFSTSVARLVTDIVRDDHGPLPSYLLHCERSSGQYLFDALLDAGAEFGIDVDGFVPPED